MSYFSLTENLRNCVAITAPTTTLSPIPSIISKTFFVCKAFDNSPNSSKNFITCSLGVEFTFKPKSADHFSIRLSRSVNSSFCSIMFPLWCCLDRGYTTLSKFYRQAKFSKKIQICFFTENFYLKLAILTKHC